MDVPGKNLLFGDGEDDDVATADLRKELFESEDVIVGRQKDSDHGLSEILERQKEKEKSQTNINNDDVVSDPYEKRLEENKKNVPQ